MTRLGLLQGGMASALGTGLLRGVSAGEAATKGWFGHFGGCRGIHSGVV